MCRCPSENRIKTNEKYLFIVRAIQKKRGTNRATNEQVHRKFPYI